MMLIFQALVVISALVAVFFPAAALFGFYEDLEEGPYRFRSGRFLTLVLLLVALPAAAILALMSGVGHKVTGAAEVAETAVAENRALDAHITDNIAVMFPNILGQQMRSCYSAAVSNYLQDQWVKNYRAETCKLGSGLCADDEQSFFEAARRQVNPSHSPFLDFDAIGLMLGTVWTTSKDMYDLIHSFQDIIAPPAFGKMHVGANAGNYEIYRRYFVNCAALKPEPWIAPNMPLVSVPAALCLGRCP